MTKKRPTNLPASIHQRLLNLSVSRSEDPNLILTRFSLERLLYRLAQSEFSDQFILKGELIDCIDLHINTYMYIVILVQLPKGFAMSNIRWSLVVPEYTDRALRSYLARTGGKKGDLSRFVDEAVLCRLFELTVGDVKDRNAEYSQDEILAAIEDGLAVD